MSGAGCGTGIRGSSTTERTTQALCRPNGPQRHNDIPSGRDMLTNDEMMPTNTARTRRGAAGGAAGAGFGTDLAAVSAVAAGALASLYRLGRPVRPHHRWQIPTSRTPRAAEPPHGDVRNQADASNDGIPRKRAVFCRTLSPIPRHSDTLAHETPCTATAQDVARPVMHETAAEVARRQSCGAAGRPAGCPHGILVRP